MNAKRGTRILGRSVKNLATGAVMYTAFTKVAGSQTARFGPLALPINMIGTGIVAEVFGGGQKDFISAGSKIGLKRISDIYLMPRIAGQKTGGNTGAYGT